jgi:hypothetical protein
MLQFDILGKMIKVEKLLVNIVIYVRCEVLIAVNPHCCSFILCDRGSDTCNVLCLQL